MNNSSSGENKYLAFGLLLGVVVVAFLSLILTSGSISKINLGSIAGVSDSQCTKAGGNAAWYLGGSHGAYDLANQYNMSWILAIVENPEDIAANRDYICNRGVKTIIRPCTKAMDGNCRAWTDPDALITQLKNLNCEVYVTGPNEITVETAQNSRDMDEMASEVARYMDKLVVGARGSKVRVLTPIYSAHYIGNESWRSITLANKVIDYMAHWNEIDGWALNAYDISTDSPYGDLGTPALKRWKQDVKSGKDLPIYVTETGPFDGNVDRFVEQFKLMQQDPEGLDIRAILMFNVFGINTSDAFAYGKLIETGAIEKVLGECMGDISDFTPRSVPSSSSSSGPKEDRNFCDVLGFEADYEPSEPSKGNEDAPYYDVPLGVQGTIACSDGINGDYSDIIEFANNTKAKNIHVVRLGTAAESCKSFKPADAIEAITQIREGTGSNVYIMPTSEPGTDLASLDSKYDRGYDDSGKAGAAGDAGGTWLAEVVKGLKSKGGSVADTKDYLIFPAFNFHQPSDAVTAPYINGFIDTYQDLTDSDEYNYSVLVDNFVSFGVSLQKYPSDGQYVGPSMGDRIADYRLNYLAPRGAGDADISFMAANVYNQVADQSYVDELKAAYEYHQDVINGIFVFAPWGWGGGGDIQNLEIPIDLWQGAMFGSCPAGDEQDTLELNPIIEAYPEMASCQAKSLGNAHLDETSARVRLQAVDEWNGEPVKESSYEIHFTISKKISVSLLDWAGHASLEGTGSNPYMTPCGKDAQVSAFGDLSRVFPAVIELEREDGGTTRYPMSNLGNALACMIWRAKNTEAGSLGLQDLEPRFSSTTFDTESVFSPNEVQDVTKLNNIPGGENMCSGKVKTLDTSDELSGEQILYNDIGTLVTLSQHKDYMEGWTASGPTYFRVDPRTFPHETAATEKLTIPGAAEALAQMYQEEYLHNPWKGQYNVIHKNKAGLKVELTSYINDVLGESGYSQPYSTEGNLSVYVGKRNTDTDGNPIASAEYYFEWLGQIVYMMERNTLISTDSIEDTYLPNRTAEIENMKVQARTGSKDLDRTVKDAVLDPHKIYMCSELDELAQEIAKVGFDADNEATDELVQILSNTDCLAPTTTTDPLNQYLCSRDLLPEQYCVDQCVPLDEIESSIGVQCPVSTNFTCLQGVGGTYSHSNDGITSSKELVTRERIALDLQPKGDSLAYAPENVTVVQSAVEYTSATLGSTCGNRMLLRSINNPDIYYSIYHLTSDSALNDSRIYQVGAVFEKGETLGTLMPSNGKCINGMHLHISVSVNQSIPVDPYSYFENACGTITCTNENRSILSTDLVLNATELPGNTDIPDVSDYYSDSEMCKTMDGESGYISDRILSEPIEGVIKSFGYMGNDELKARVMNICPINIGDCDATCKNQIDSWVVGLAKFNENILKKSGDYNPNTLYTISEIQGFMDQMYNSKRPDDISYPLLISVWLAENGLNPLHKNPGFDSDVFGCGVGCGVPPQNFKEELACITRRLNGCSAIRIGNDESGNPQYMGFNSEKPGEYLEKYGPIATNGTFTYEVIAILNRLSEISNLNVARSQDGVCELNVYNPAINEAEILPWIDSTLNYN